MTPAALCFGARDLSLGSCADTASLAWVFGLKEHLKRQGYEASKLDSLKPRKYMRGCIRESSLSGVPRHSLAPCPLSRDLGGVGLICEEQGYLDHEKTPTPLGTP